MPYKDPEQRRAWERANRAKRNTQRQAQRAAHPEKRRAYCAVWYLKNRDRITARAYIYRTAHPEKAQTRQAAWRAKNPEKRAVQDSRRRAQKRNARVNDFTAQQWRDMQAAYDYRCVYCGKRCKGKLTIDHIVSLAKGGSHTLSNIVPACGLCNSRKGTGHVLAPVQPLLLTAPPSPQKRRKS